MQRLSKDRALLWRGLQIRVFLGCTAKACREYQALVAAEWARHSGPGTHALMSNATATAVGHFDYA
jgi:hypothetical protein